MAKKMMARTKLGKAMVVRCSFCGLGDVYSDTYDKFVEKTKEKFPERELLPWWRADDYAPGVPGYKVLTFRTIRGEEDRWHTDGLVTESSFDICENCMAIINKCFQNIGDAEEIAFARKETKVFPMPDLEDVTVKPEEE